MTASLNPTLNLSSNPGNHALRDYAELVDKCANERLDFPIANGSAEHARILIAKLFEIASQRVTIVSGTLRQFSPLQQVEIYSYGPVIEHARNFLRRKNSKLEIVVQSGELDGGKNNKLIRELADDDKRVGEIAVYLPKAGLLGVDIAHFMVSDNSAFRMETGADANPKHRGIAAIANFGDSRTAVALDRYFGTLKRYLDRRDNLADTITFAPKSVHVPS